MRDGSDSAGERAQIVVQWRGTGRGFRHRRGYVTDHARVVRIYAAANGCRFVQRFALTFSIAKQTGVPAGVALGRCRARRP